MNLTAREGVDVVATGGALERAFPFEGVPVGVDALDAGTERQLLTIEDMTRGGHRRQPGHRRLQPGREHRCRAR